MTVGVDAATPSDAANVLDTARQHRGSTPYPIDLELGYSVLRELGRPRGERFDAYPAGFGTTSDGRPIDGWLYCWPGRGYGEPPKRLAATWSLAAAHFTAVASTWDALTTAMRSCPPAVERESYLVAYAHARQQTRSPYGHCHMDSPEVGAVNLIFYRHTSSAAPWITPTPGRWVVGIQLAEPGAARVEAIDETPSRAILRLFDALGQLVCDAGAVHARRLMAQLLGHVRISALVPEALVRLAQAWEAIVRVMDVAAVARQATWSALGQPLGASWIACPGARALVIDARDRGRIT